MAQEYARHRIPRKKKKRQKGTLFSKGSSNLDSDSKFLDFFKSKTQFRIEESKHFIIARDIKSGKVVARKRKKPGTASGGPRLTEK